MTNVKYLKVALDTPLRNTFDYLPPNNFNHSKLQIGQMVLVPFATRKLVGVIVEITNHTAVEADKLKAVISVLDNGNLLPLDVMQLCRWSANYYHHSIGEVFACALPSLIKTGASTNLQQIKFWHLNKNLNLANLPKLSIKQREIVHIFQQHPDGISEKVMQSLKLSTSVINVLLKKNIIVVQYQEVEKSPKPLNLLAQTEINLNAQQKNALDVVSDNLDSFKVFLLAGVTGSGKTEIYLQLIRLVIENNMQVLVLIPEINLTPQTLARFSARFNAKIAVIHSGVSDKEKMKAWIAARDGDADIIIGTRSAIFTPLPKLGLIIVDEEHDQSYKQQETLRYNARDLAVIRAKMANAPLLLGSATPSLESLHNVKLGKYQLLNLPKRAGGASLPKFFLVDIKGAQLNNGITNSVLDEIAQTLKNKQQVLVFLNKRGFAQVMLCHDCGYVLDCPNCDARLVFHQKNNILRCHHCEYTTVKATNCPKCGSHQLIAVGFGTERIEENLARLFSDYKVLRVDRDSASTKDALADIFSIVHSGTPCILVGTQMLAKGHHFPLVTLVVILDIDNGLYSSDFRAVEKMAQTVVQVAGRAGREQNPGKVLIQTHMPNHKLLQQLTQHGYLDFADIALRERSEANLPPFSFMALIRSSAIKIEATKQFLKQVAEHANIELLRLKITSVEVLGPVAASMAYRAGRYRMQLLLQSNNRADLHKLVQILILVIENMPEAKKVRWSIDVDPIDLF